MTLENNLNEHSDQQKLMLLKTFISENNTFNILGQREDGEYVNVAITLGEDIPTILEDLTNGLSTLANACSPKASAEMERV